MTQILTAPLGAKAQITLPRLVRQVLGLKQKQDLVGFIVEGNKVALTRVEPVPSTDPFTAQEWQKIKRFVAGPPSSVLCGSQESIRHLKKKLGV